MTKQEIINFEQAAPTGTVTLVKEGMFWRAYEQSAYLFERLFWPGVKINGGFVKTAGKDIFYCGFPDGSLQKVLNKIPEVKGARLAGHSDLLVTIVDVPHVEGFEAWKESLVMLRRQAADPMQPAYGKLPLYKAVYDFFQQIVILTRHFPKDLYHSLGDKIIEKGLEMNTHLFRTLHIEKGSPDYAHNKSSSIARIEELLESERFLLRVAFDLKLYNNERFAELSAKLDAVGKHLNGWRLSGQMIDD